MLGERRSDLMGYGAHERTSARGPQKEKIAFPNGIVIVKGSFSCFFGFLICFCPFFGIECGAVFLCMMMPGKV